MIGLSPYQLLRAFIRQYGLPPHAYLVQLSELEWRAGIEALDRTMQDDGSFCYTFFRATARR